MLRLFIIVFVLFVFMQCAKKERIEVEPNNSFKLAESISLNSFVSGYINSKDDVDIYSFQIQKETAIFVNLSGIKGINVAFQIWRNSSFPEKLKIIDDNRKSSPEELGAFLLKPGVYSIVVLHGSRDVKKSNIEDRYVLSVAEVDVETNNFEFEPNDNAKEATEIKLNGFLKGLFSPGYNKKNINDDNKFREEDWYYFDLNLVENIPIIVSVSLTKVSGINSVLELYSPSGEIISKSDFAPQGIGESIKKIGLRNSGRYYVLVTSVGYNSNVFENYTLELATSEYNSSNEIEPNNELSKANIIQNDLISGTISSARDVDHFIFKKNSDKNVYRVVFNSDTISTLRISNSKGEEILKFKTPLDKNYIVLPNLKVIETINFSVSSETGNDSIYSLSITPVKDTDLLDAEPNNSKDFAQEIDNSSILGYTSYQSDKDYFVLNTASRQKHKITVLAPLNGSIKVSITDPLGYIVKSVKVNNGETKEFFEIIDLKGYLIVESLLFDTENPYVIKLNKE